MTAGTLVEILCNYPSTVAFYRDGLELPIVDGWDRGPDDKGVLFGAASGIIEVVAGLIVNPPPSAAG